MFEKTFFSAQAKRVDLTLTSEAHKEENTEFRQSNTDTDMFKGMDRTVHDATHGVFRKQMMLYPDNIKNNYQRFIDGTHKY